MMKHIIKFLFLGLPLLLIAVLTAIGAVFVNLGLGIISIIAFTFLVMLYTGIPDTTPKDKQ